MLLYFFNYLNKNYLILFSIILTYWPIYRCAFLVWLNSIDYENYNFCSIHTWPSSLLYGFNLIHPLLFYSGFVCTGFYILTNIFSHQSKLKYIYIVSLGALLLGMYWGSINEVWGFFWTYDRVEFALINLLLLLFSYQHSNKTLTKFWFYYYVYLSLLLYILLLRYNILFTIHSFFIAAKLFFLIPLQILILVLFYFKISQKNIHYTVLNLYTYIYIIYCTIYSMFWKIKKYILFSHFLFFILLVNLVLPTYYYAIFNTPIYNLFTFVNIFTDTLTTDFFFFFNTTINYMMYFNNCFYYIYSQMFLYQYVYYFGYFYYIVLISLWRFILI